MALDREGGIDLPFLEGMAWGLRPSPSQPYRGQRTLRLLKLWGWFHHGRWHRGRTPTSLLSDGALIRTRNEHKPMLSHLAPSRRQRNGKMS
jgi:hypothetical protein